MNTALVLERSMSSHRVTDRGCWEYTGYIQPLGYGQLYVEGKQWRVHRLMFTIVNGPIPDDIDVLHECDNPPCFNPGHLHGGDQLQNVLESVERGRHHKVAQTHCKRGHEFTAENTIIEGGWRHCRICMRAYDRIRAGWPEDLAYSEPARPGRVPNGMARGKWTGRERVPAAIKTHCKNGHELTDENVYVTPTGYRQCRRCRTESVYKFAKKLGAPSQRDGDVGT
jgi:hypothetical protein